MSAARSPDLVPGARVRSVVTSQGPARVHVVDPRATRRTRGTLVLGHGAGGGVEAADLLALAVAARDTAWRVVLVEQPWRVAGRKVASAPTTLDAAWLAVVADLQAADEVVGPLVVGGRSAGARVACRTATAVGAVGAVLLAFPLHPPGRPDRNRVGEVRGAGVPVLVVQGERDPFGSADDVRRATAEAVAEEVEVIEVPGADHALRVARTAPITQAEALELVTATATRRLAEWAAGTGR